VSANLGYEQIVRSYRARFRPKTRRELAWFTGQVSLREAIACAGLAVDDRGKRYRHQSRIPRSVLRRAQRVLLGNEVAIRRTNTFAELLELVESVVGQMRGIGELYCYDTALRIGAKRGFLPEAVYLHRGTRDGAGALGLPRQARSLSVEQLPRSLRSLAPHEIEDLLCIYKRRLAGVGSELSLRCE